MALQLPPTASHSSSYHGRRLMQMLFKANASNNDEHSAEQEPGDASQKHTSQSSGANNEKQESSTDPRDEEDAAHCPQKNGGGGRGGGASHRKQLPMPSAPPSKFYSLKRKLFPSRMRTAHPIRIPPLVTSPISVSSSSSAELHDANDQPSQRTSNQQSSTAAEPRRAVGTGEEDDDDLELEIAIDNLDSATEQDTLDEMSRAIASLHQWRQHQEQEMQDAMRRIDELTEPTEAVGVADEDSQALEQEYERKKQQRENERERQSASLRHLEATFQARVPKTTLDDDDTARVEQVLLESSRFESGAMIGVSTAGGGGGSEPSSEACRLRGEIFELGVRELSSSIQATLLLELEGAESELDMKLFDVEAFASDLDSVLAQFSEQEQASIGRVDEVN